MGPVEPPQRKGWLPQYACHQLLELQQKFDELETLGVFICPEDINVAVEYLNPSFLIKKANGGHGLVTAFAYIGCYSKPQAFSHARRQLHPTYCQVETHRHDRPDQRILPDSTFRRLYEILWRCYTISGCACGCAVRHAHARVRDSPRRAHEPSTR